MIPCLLILKLTKTGSCSLFFLPGSILATAYFNAAGPVRDSTLNEPRYATLHAKQQEYLTMLTSSLKRRLTTAFRDGRVDLEQWMMRAFSLLPTV